MCTCLSASSFLSCLLTYLITLLCWELWFSLDWRCLAQPTLLPLSLTCLSLCLSHMSRSLCQTFCHARSFQKSLLPIVISFWVDAAWHFAFGLENLLTCFFFICNLNRRRLCDALEQFSCAGISTTQGKNWNPECMINLRQCAVITGVYTHTLKCTLLLCKKSQTSRPSSSPWLEHLALLSLCHSPPPKCPLGRLDFSSFEPQKRGSQSWPKGENWGHNQNSIHLL